MSLPSELQLWRSDSSSAKMAKFEFLSEESFSFERVRELVIELCDPGELNRIAKMIPNLVSFYGFDDYRSSWCLSHMANLCKALAESAATMEVISIPVELEESESYRQVLDLNPTKYAKKVEIFSKSMQNSLLEARMRSGRHTSMSQVHSLYSLVSYIQDKESTKLTLKDKSNGNTLCIEYKECF